MTWSRIADLLDRILTIPLALPAVDGTAYIAAEAPRLDVLLEEVAETEADRGALDDYGWSVVGDLGVLREVLSFDYLSMVGGGAIIWWLLEGEDERRYLVYEDDLIPSTAFARLDGDPGVLIGPVIERYFATNGEGLGVGESSTMLPDRLNNAAPDLLPEAFVRAGAFAFMKYAEEHYGGWEYLSPAYSDPQTPEEKEAAFADYWRRNYVEVRESGAG